MSTLKALARTLFSSKERLSYRRLLAWAGACGMLAAGLISESSWLYVTMAFMGLEVVGKLGDVIAKTKSLEPKRPSDEPKA